MLRTGKSVKKDRLFSIDTSPITSHLSLPPPSLTLSTKTQNFDDHNFTINERGNPHSHDSYSLLLLTVLLLLQ